MHTRLATWGVRSAIARATASVPAAKRPNSNTPMGPFQRTVRAPWSAPVNSRTLSGPMSRPCAPGAVQGKCSAPTTKGDKY